MFTPNCSALNLYTFTISSIHFIALNFYLFFLKTPDFSYDKSRISATWKLKILSLDFKTYKEKSY